MGKNLLLILLVCATFFTAPSSKLSQEKEILNSDNSVFNQMMSLITTAVPYNNLTANPLSEAREMLRQQATNLNEAVINKVLTTLKCANEYNVDHNNILTIIDYSLPSNEKRLWVFDLKNKKLLFNTYVSHGLNSGALLSTFFSNKYNSKSSSIGVYKTEKPYYGRHGLSLKLEGLESGFNDNASNRSVVMHGGWYVDENFIKRYGRAGRSWGCPAVPDGLSQPIINTIKDKSLFVVYYPSDRWFLKSKFLNCDNLASTQSLAPIGLSEAKSPIESETREEVLFANVHTKVKRADTDPIVTMSADNYERIFHAKAPLNRMLRRQINNVEYIALSDTEFRNIVASNDREGLNAVSFVIPVIKMEHGYYATEMQIVDLGKIKEVRLNLNPLDKVSHIGGFIVDFYTHPSISLRTTNQFIRWLGL